MTSVMFSPAFARSDSSLVGMVALALLPYVMGFVLDLLLGDPPGWPHPVRLIGWLISRMETLLRLAFPDTALGKRRAGLVLSIVVPATTYLLSLGLLAGGYWLNFWLGLAIECVLCWQVLATRSLKTETSKVLHALNKEDLPRARQMLSWLVGRDTAELTQAGVIRGAVETIAENTTDGVIAPLFYLAIGGAPLALAYKAINTLDSMVGYKNERHLDFGRHSAKLDDAANFLPARLAAVLMVLGSVLRGYPAGQTWLIYRRDRHNHASPNSAQTEAVCAGALGIQLGGSNTYFGKVVDKPTIGDRLREPIAQDIKSTQVLLYGTALIGLLAFLPIRLLSVLLLIHWGG